MSTLLLVLQIPEKSAEVAIFRFEYPDAAVSELTSENLGTLLLPYATTENILNSYDIADCDYLFRLHVESLPEARTEMHRILIILDENPESLAAFVVEVDDAQLAGLKDLNGMTMNASDFTDEQDALFLEWLETLRESTPLKGSFSYDNSKETEELSSPISEVIFLGFAL